MNKSKSMAVAAAALAMCMAGSAFAQDHRFDRGPDRHNERHDRHEQQYQRQSGPNNGHYQQRHQDFRPGAQYGRQAHPNPHVEWRRGGHVPREYRGRNYVVNDWRGHRLHQPPRGYQWVGVGGEFALAAIATGLIAQIIVSQ